MLYVLAFALGTWTNMKVLQTANVETVIVFRSCCPIVVAGFDYLFYGRACPSLRSVASLLLITGGAVGYILNDKEFQNSGWVAYYWVMIWWTVRHLPAAHRPAAHGPDPGTLSLTLSLRPSLSLDGEQVLIFQLTYGKFLVSGLELKSLWTPVLYTNTLSVLPAMLVGLMAGELSQARLQGIELTNAALFWLLTSCVVGICISWAGFLCQSLVTATSYTVVGVMNKMLTVTVNVLIWDKHASVSGIFSLAVCLIGGSLYQQAPPRVQGPEGESLKRPGSHTEESEEELEPVPGSRR